MKTSTCILVGLVLHYEPTHAFIESPRPSSTSFAQRIWLEKWAISPHEGYPGVRRKQCRSERRWSELVCAASPKPQDDVAEPVPLQYSQQHKQEQTSVHHSSLATFLSRRHAVNRLLFTAVATTPICALADEIPAKLSNRRPRNIRPTCYAIVDRYPRMMQPYSAVGEKKLEKQLGNDVVLFMGHHPESVADHTLEASLIQNIANARGKAKPLTVCLSAVSPKAQKALNEYCSRIITDDEEAENALEANADWLYPMANYLPVLRLARSRPSTTLIATGVDGATITKVRQGGLEAMNDEERRAYVRDPIGFVDSVKSAEFKFYSDKVIGDAYTRAIPPNSTTPLGNFFASEILQHEAAASQVADQVRIGGEGKSASLVVALGTLDEVKYRYGTPGRFERMSTGKDAVTIAINPSPRDSLSTTKALQLSLGTYLKVQNSSLADYIYFSSSPPVSAITKMLNPI